MKTQTTKRSTCRLAASIAIATAIATSGVWAANRTWKGGTGGTEANPLDICLDSNWDPAGTPTGSDHLIFTNIVDEVTVLTNSYFLFAIEEETARPAAAKKKHRHTFVYLCFVVIIAVKIKCLTR